METGVQRTSESQDSAVAQCIGPSRHTRESHSIIKIGAQSQEEVESISDNENVFEHAQLEQIEGTYGNKDDDIFTKKLQMFEGSQQQRRLPQHWRPTSEYLPIQKKIFEKDLATIENAKVAIRLRPKIKREQEQSEVLEVKEGKLYDALMEKSLKLSSEIQVFGDNTTTEQLFDQVNLEQMIWSAIDGQNLTVMCYGHTSAGKTYTMFGNKDRNPGIVPLTLETIFAYIYEKIGTEFLLRVSYLEIYNEQINDLLSPNSYRTASSNTDKVTEEICINIEQIYSLIRMGDINRHIGVTRSNDRSSRAHTLFTIIIEKLFRDPTSDFQERVTQSVINLVDLSGSESISERDESDLISLQTKETNFINKSIYTLNQVMTMLSESNETQDWIPFRDSKLTKYLQPFLEGNSKMLWIFNMSPSETFYRINKQTAGFASQLSNIKQCLKTKALQEAESMILKIKKTIKSLKHQLKTVEVLIQKKEQQLDQQDSQSVEFDMEMEEKLRLLNEIKKIQSQILISERVSQFMKKFDKRRRSSVAALDLQESANQNKRKSIVQERLSKRLDKAREFVRTSTADSNYLEVQSSQDMRRQSKVRRSTVGMRASQRGKGSYQASNQSSSQESPEKLRNDSAKICVDRLSYLDKMIGSDDQVNKQSKMSITRGMDSVLNKDDNLLDDDMDELFGESTPLSLLQQTSGLFDMSKPNNTNGNRDRQEEDQASQEDEQDQDYGQEQDEEDQEEDNPSEQSQHELSQNDYRNEFSAIEEEEDEEDSFERERRSRRFCLQKEYEEKLQDMEMRLANTVCHRRNSRLTMGQQKDEIGFEEDDEDLLQNFDSLPRFSIVELLDQHRQSVMNRPGQTGENSSSNRKRDTISRKTIDKKVTRLSMTNGNSGSALLRRQSLKKQEPIAVVCTKCQGKASEEEYRMSLFEADKRFLENLLQSKDNDIEKTRSQLKEMEQHNQQLQRDKNELLNYVTELEEQINEVSQTNKFEQSQ